MVRSDLRHALRSLRRSPWYAATVVVVIALGIGLATTVFAVVDGVLFKPLPYPRVNELFGLAPDVARAGDPVTTLRPVSPAHLAAWREAVPGAAFTGFNTSGSELTLGGAPVELALVDARFLEVLGQRPLIGGFRAEHFEPPGPVRAALITYGLWQRAFGGDPAVVGRIFPNESADGRPLSSTEVVGILPRAFLFPSPSGLFRPEVLVARPAAGQPAQEGLGLSLRVVARIPPDVPRADVERSLADATGEVAKRYPPARPGSSRSGPYDTVHVVPIRSALTSLTRPQFAPIFVTSAVLLLLACVNLAGLAGARMQDRRHELALRRALGASRGDLLRLAGTESGLTAFAGTALGLALASALLGVARALMPAYAFLKTPAIDARVVGFCALAASLSVVLVTLWSARFSESQLLRPTLAEAGTMSRRHSLARTALVGAQVGLAFVLVLGGGLFVTSVGRVWREDPGIVTDHAFRMELAPRGKRPDIATINGLIASVRRVPGVVAAGGLEHGFLQQIFNGSVFDAPPGVDGREIESLPVSAGFFEAAGLHAIEGRLPSDDELERGSLVIAVSQRAAERYWPGRQALGQSLTYAGRPFTVVGVVQEIRYRSLDVEPEGEVYWPLAADAEPYLWNVYIRLAPGADGAMASILQGLAADFPAFEVFNLQTAEQSFGEGIRRRRFQAWLFGTFAVAALVTVGAGVLGLLAMTTARRTREIGIRLALGATRGRIVRLLAREQFAAVAAGLAAAGMVSAWGVQFVRASLYHLTGYDAEVWALAACVIIAAAAAGTLGPAFRASRTDPMEALRAE